MFADTGASQIVHNGEELAQAVLPLLKDEDLAQAIGQKGKQIVESNKGALQRLLVLLEPLVDQVGNP